MTNDDELDFLAVAADDLALGRLAAGAGQSDGDDAALGLLASLRADLDLAAAAVDAATTTAPQAVLPIVRPRRRPWLPVLTAAAAVGLLAGAVVAQDRPGQALYPVRRAILGDSVDEVGEISALLDRVSADISLARRTLDDEALDRADDRLDDARDKIDDVDDAFVRADLDRRATALEADLERAEDFVKDADGGSDSGSSGSDGSGDDSSGSGSSGSDDSDSSGSGSGSDSDSSGSSGSGSGSDSDSSGSGSGGSAVGEESGEDAADSDSSGSGSSGSHDSGSSGSDSSGSG